jgi:hypothetical protein
VIRRVADDVDLRGLRQVQVFEEQHGAAGVARPLLIREDCGLRAPASWNADDALGFDAHREGYRAYQLKRPDALRLASEEHQAIIDAIVAGDGDAAFALLTDHVSLSNELFGDLVAALSAADAESAG